MNKNELLKLAAARIVLQETEKKAVPWMLLAALGLLAPGVVKSFQDRAQANSAMGRFGNMIATTSLYGQGQRSGMFDTLGPDVQNQLARALFRQANPNIDTSNVNFAGNQSEQPTT